MRSVNTLSLITGMPKLLAKQALKPIQVAMRQPSAYPMTQQQMADLVENALVHEIRAGFTHRFITLLFVTVGERVFCRRYTYGEPSWHSAFLAAPEGQIKLDKTIVNIKASVPHDMDKILPQVDQAYAHKLKQLGASFMLAGAVEPRAQQSTIELCLVPDVEMSSVLRSSIDTQHMSHHK